MRLSRVQFTVWEMMTVTCVCAILLSLSPHIYWFHVIVGGSLLGFMLHRRRSGKGVIGGVSGGWASATLVAVLAYMGPIDRGGPMQWAIRHRPVSESVSLSILGASVGLSVSTCLSLFPAALGRFGFVRGVTGRWLRLSPVRPGPKP
jgi:hypothetical protein